MARRPPRWTIPFLRELSRTGNVRLAAERAGVDYTTAYQRRKLHGDFARAWEEALRLYALHSAPDERGGENAARSALPASVSRRSGGGELIARPDGKLIKASEARWGKRAEERFLTELTVSGSVRLAAKAAGFSTTAVYRRRLKDAHFAAAWEAAVDTGKARVHCYLVEAATRTFDPDELPVADDRAIPKVSISEAINIAKLKASAEPAAAGGTRARAGAAGSRGVPDGGVASDEEVYQALAKRLKAFGVRIDQAYEQAAWVEHVLPGPPGTYGDPEERVWLPPGWRIVGPDGEEAGAAAVTR